LQILAASQTLSRLGSNPPIFISIILCCRKRTLLILGTCGILRDIVDKRTEVQNLFSHLSAPTASPWEKSPSVPTKSRLGRPKSRSGLFGQKKYPLPVQVIAICLYCLVCILYRGRCSDSATVRKSRIRG